METECADAVSVKCEICCREVPQSAARSAEAGNCAVYFCGPDCSEEWLERREMEELKLLCE